MAPPPGPRRGRSRTPAPSDPCTRSRRPAAPPTRLGWRSTPTVTRSSSGPGSTAPTRGYRRAGSQPPAPWGRSGPCPWPARPRPTRNSRSTVTAMRTSSGTAPTSAACRSTAARSPPRGRWARSSASRARPRRRPIRGSPSTRPATALRSGSARTGSTPAPRGAPCRAPGRWARSRAFRGRARTPASPGWASTRSATRSRCGRARWAATPGFRAGPSRSPASPARSRRSPRAARTLPCRRSRSTARTASRCGRAWTAPARGSRPRPCRQPAASGSRTRCRRRASATAPQVAADGDGDATVVWQRSDGSHLRIQERPFSPFASPQPIVNLSPVGSDAAAPQVARSGGAGGEAVAVWSHPDDVSSHQRIQASVGP